ncbi:MAG: UpxY family transcription antiterminator [Ignavibacteria bacterium]|nr:UpxY family transcription antiterminator [Ignavibacteria bacterium]
MSSSRWFVIHTKPRNEKKVLEQVLVRDIEAYLPMIETIRFWSDRKKKVQVPLFPGYVFVHGDESERRKAISGTYGAIKYVMFQKRHAVIKDEEISNIMISLKAPDRIRIEDAQMSVGDLVEVTYGLFKGLKGFITQIRGNYKLTVNIIELNTTFSVQLSNAEVNLVKRL